MKAIRYEIKLNKEPAEFDLEFSITPLEILVRKFENKMQEMFEIKFLRIMITECIFFVKPINERYIEETKHQIEKVIVESFKTMNMNTFFINGRKYQSVNILEFVRI